MEFPFWVFCWPTFPTRKEREESVSEKLLFGVFVPFFIFLVSTIATLLIYRRFARPLKISGGQKKSGEPGKIES